ncbi:hypothetical protein CLIB1444_01S01530 [[Candida] jaroonii]|uniref:Uncharacterized protein n=1 Tax=[Candida] jaroonii TaxID=467808 RepID=A0ACA9Y034_9ASCO|nr:hypothetical protein CLIB1444_01S01530 [[Candida] jaroonii]
MDDKSKQDRIILELQLILKTSKQIEDNLLKSIELIDGEENFPTSRSTFDESIIQSTMFIQKVISLLQNIDNDEEVEASRLFIEEENGSKDNLSPNESDYS